MNRIVKATQGAFFNILHHVRNPDDGHLDLFQEKVERTLFAVVQNDVRFVDKQDGLLVLVLGGREKDTPHTFLQRLIFKIIPVNSLSANIGEHQGAMQLTGNGLGKFRLAGPFDAVKEQVEPPPLLGVLEHIKGNLNFRIVTAERLVRHTVAFVHLKIERIEVVSRLPVQKTIDTHRCIQVLIEQAHLLKGTPARNCLFKFEVWKQQRKNIRRRRIAKPIVGLESPQQAFTLRLVKENPREH